MGELTDTTTSRPRILDLCCGAGGAARGYHRAGLAPFGVDIALQPRYPYPFVHADVLDRVEGPTATPGYLTLHGHEFDAIHLSAPCQKWSDLAARNGNAHAWPDLITPLRPILRRLGVPYVIENVPGAPLIGPTWLCGCRFPGLRVLRKRGFETNFPVDPPPPCLRPHPLVFTHDKRKAHHGRLDQNTSYVQVTGGGNCTVVNARDAMGIDWMSKDELNEAIPPAYTEYIGRFLLAAV